MQRHGNSLSLETRSRVSDPFPILFPQAFVFIYTAARGATVPRLTEASRRG